MMKNTKTVIIVDDEASSRDLLSEYLLDHPAFKLIQACTNGYEAVQAVNTLQPDLVFLDIEMPGKNGFQVLQEITIVPQVIFTTAYDEFALKAFEVNAIDYLLKPYTKSRFWQAVNKTITTDLASGKSVTNLVQSGTSQKFPERLFAVLGNQLVNVHIDEIIRIEADGDYTRIHARGQFYISGYSMNELEKRLDPTKFARVHRSSIISIAQISTINTASSMDAVVMKNGDEVAISRSYQKSFKAIIR